MKMLTIKDGDESEEDTTLTVKAKVSSSSGSKGGSLAIEDAQRVDVVEVETGVEDVVVSSWKPTLNMFSFLSPS